MRTIERTGQFKRDYKREMKGQHRKVLDGLLLDVLRALVSDQPLPAKNRDHALIGDWAAGVGAQCVPALSPEVHGLAV